MIRFAHPAELRVARLLDSFGVRWLYEPTTFPLITSEDGLPVRCFTPDFYLPDHNVYVEMTTMRQSLVTRKNRKFRLMRELFPQLDVRLLYRKDVELIIERYGARSAVAEGELGSVLMTAEQVRRKAQEIAAHLAGSGGGPVGLIALGVGAERFRDLICQELLACGGVVTSATITITPAADQGQLFSAAIQPGPGADLRACRRVLVADVIGTGLTSWAAQSWLDAAGIPADGVVTMLERRSARLIEVPLDIPGMSAPSSWIVGCGLGRGKFAKGLPDLHSVLARHQA